MLTQAPRTSTGIPGLDPLIEGGFPAHRAILLRGQSGTGKTIFGLQFLARGLAAGEKGAFISADQKPLHLIADASGFGWDLKGAMSRNDLTVLDAAPYFTATRRRGWGPSGVDARQLASDLTEQIRKFGARRLVIDSLTSLVPMDMTPGDAHNYLRSLIQSLEDNLGCTILFTWRGAAAADPQGIGDAAEYLSSGILELKLTPAGHRFARTLVVRKMRGTQLKPAEYPVRIDRDHALSVIAPIESASVRELAAV